MKEIGGYLEFEVKNNNFSNFHHNSILLNTARNSFEYILRVKNIKNIYIPHYTCEVMLEPLHKLNVNYIYYNVDLKLEPIIDENFDRSIPFLYTNYFGIKSNIITKLNETFENLILDNSMAFYNRPLEGIDTFYSARKFFGVSDGAFLYTNMELEDGYERDVSYKRISHLFKRIELGANSAYKEFLENDFTLYNQPIRKMSVLTQRILESIDYEKVKLIRERNFLYLHENLHTYNELEVKSDTVEGPMFYPFLYKQENLKQRMLERKIYIPTLWRNTLSTAGNDSNEIYLVKNLCSLPIDQRYSLKDMNMLIQTILRLMNS